MLAGLMLGLALLLGASGCAGGTTCPAIGYDNRIDVDASIFGDDVFVQLCVKTRCSEARGEQPTPSSDSRTPIRVDDESFSLGMTAPAEVTVRVYDASGVVIHESTHALAWTHSTEVCGGPSTTAPIILAV
jgi:hypothetical protein